MPLRVSRVQNGAVGDARIALRHKVHSPEADNGVAVVLLGLTELAYSLAKAGRLPESRRILQRLQGKSKRDWVPAYNLAVVHIALNEKEAALNYLQKAYQERDWAMMVLAVEPRLDPLRGNSAFQELLGKCRLPL